MYCKQEPRITFFPFSAHRIRWSNILGNQTYLNLLAIFWYSQIWDVKSCNNTISICLLPKGPWGCQPTIYGSQCNIYCILTSTNVKIWGHICLNFFFGAYITEISTGPWKPRCSLYIIVYLLTVYLFLQFSVNISKTWLMGVNLLKCHL